MNDKSKKLSIKSVSSTKQKEIKLDDVIKESDKCILLTEKNGIVQFMALKNVNYAIEIKAMLSDALDNYKNRYFVSKINILEKKLDIILYQNEQSNKLNKNKKEG